MKVKYEVNKCEYNCGEFSSETHSTWSEVGEAIDTHDGLERRSEHGVFYEIQVIYES